MKLRCPKCKAELGLKNVPGTCPHCGENVYFYDKWRWLRGISCAVVALLPMCLWYRFDGTLLLFVRWSVVVWILWFVLFFLVSYRILKPELRLAPQDGAIRLDL